MEVLDIPGEYFVNLVNFMAGDTDVHIIEGKSKQFSRAFNKKLSVFGSSLYS
jgi:hypothetical protein